MGKLFDGAKLKIERAKCHVNELEREIRAFHERRPYEVVANDDPKTGDQLFVVHVREEVPPHLSAIIGDIVHNIRAGLDLALCDAVRAASGPNSVVRDHGFPIFDKRQDYRRHLTRKINGTNARTRRLIERLKPYKSGNQALWTIHNLDILDKHKSIIPVGAAYRHFTMHVTMPVPWQDEPIVFPGINIRPADRMYPLQHGTTIFKVARAARNSKSQADYEFAFEVSFGEGEIVEGKSLLPTLGQLRRYAERIIKLMERCNT